MSWLDLESDVLGEFAVFTEHLVVAREHAEAVARAKRIQIGRDYYAFVRSAPAFRERENAALRIARGAKRQTKADARPPCPKCGAKIARVGATAKLPTYCSKKCRVSLSNARHYLKSKGSRDHAAEYAATTPGRRERQRVANRERMRRARAAKQASC